MLGPRRGAAVRQGIGRAGVVLLLVTLLVAAGACSSNEQPQETQATRGPEVPEPEVVAAPEKATEPEAEPKPEPEAEPEATGQADGSTEESGDEADDEPDEPADVLLDHHIGLELEEFQQRWNATIDGLGFGHRLEGLDSELFDDYGQLVRHYREIPGGEIGVMLNSNDLVTSVMITGQVMAEGDMAVLMATAMAMATAAEDLDADTAGQLVSTELLNDGDIDTIAHSATVEHRYVTYYAVVNEPYVDFSFDSWGTPDDPRHG